ncbi:MAG TPA: YIP1 family protein [Longilinea sp.]|nr:YIP1 family protein [Longilinea sp.]
MKKIIRIILIASIPLIALIFFRSSINASAESPYTTWALGPGGRLFQTQDAYVPSAEINLPISGAEDMFVTPDGYFYIADTGNGQIVKLKDFKVVATYGAGILKGPSGIFVDDKGIMYIADAQKNTVVILDKDGNLVKEFGRPVEPLFGKNKEFLPRKIAVDARKNLYIISEGSVNGVVQMNTNGNFIGYFGANTSTVSLKMVLQRMFLTKEQLAQFVKNEAASPSNLAIDNQSLVYTITAGTTSQQSIRKFTIAGRNIFPNAHGSTTFRDINVSDDGLILAVDATGQIYEYDLNGTMLFEFGAEDKGDQRLGTLKNPTAIERYQDFIYVLDKDKNAIVSFQTTAFAKTVHNGVGLYMGGFYREAKPYFEQVINFNGSFIMSYQAIADAYFKAQDYPNALAAYKLAEFRNGYSQAYWEMRNVSLQRSLTPALLAIFGLWVSMSVVGRLDKRYKWFDPARKWFKDLTRIKLIDDFVFMFRFIKQPADSFYYIKIKQRGSLLFAGLIYLWVLIVRVLVLYVTGFIFNPNASLANIHPENVIVITLLAFVIWNAANYLISTISDGEGRVRDVIIGSAYSLFPYVLFALPIALISNVLTMNEVFIYSFSVNIMWFWTGLMLFIMVKEIHNYSFSETIRNVLLTLFTMAIFLLTGYILYILFTQLFGFVSAIIQEVGLRG